MQHKLLWLLLAASFVSCQSSSDNFIPLEAGMEGLYEVEYMLGANVQKASAVSRVEGEQEIAGKKYFKTVFVVSGIPGIEPEVAYQRLAEDGLYELRYVEEKPVEQLSIPLPFTIGSTWSSRFGDFEQTCRVDSREPAILPEKTYEDAYKFSCTGSGEGRRFKSYSYLAAGVGIVRIVQEVGDGGMVFDMRLREVRKVDA